MPSTRGSSRRSSAALVLLASAALVVAPVAGATAAPPPAVHASAPVVAGAQVHASATAFDGEDARPAAGVAVLVVALLSSAVAAGVASRRRTDGRR